MSTDDQADDQAIWQPIIQNQTTPTSSWQPIAQINQTGVGSSWEPMTQLQIGQTTSAPSWSPVVQTQTSQTTSTSPWQPIIQTSQVATGPSRAATSNWDNAHLEQNSQLSLLSQPHPPLPIVQYVEAATAAIKKLTDKSPMKDFEMQVNIETVKMGIDCCKYAVAATTKKIKDKGRLQKQREMERLFYKRAILQKYRDEGMSRKKAKIHFKKLYLPKNLKNVKVPHPTPPPKVTFETQNSSDLETSAIAEVGAKGKKQRENIFSMFYPMPTYNA
jgi:hypothetical protein